MVNVNMVKILQKLNLTLMMICHDKLLNLHILTIIVRSAFENEGKFYPQVYLNECLCEL